MQNGTGDGPTLSPGVLACMQTLGSIIAFSLQFWLHYLPAVSAGRIMHGVFSHMKPVACSL